MEGIEAVHPDAFIEQQMEMHEGVVINVAKQHRASLKNPPKTIDEYLDPMAAQGLVVTTDRLRDFRELI